MRDIADIHSSTNEIEVVYTTSINNAGKGWAIDFTSEKSGT